MALPGATRFTRFFAKTQPTYGTPVDHDTFVTADTLHVISCDITEAGARGISRANVQTGYGGAAKSVQGTNSFDITIVTEIFAPILTGQISAANTAITSMCNKILWDKCWIDHALGDNGTLLTSTYTDSVLFATEASFMSIMAQTPNGLTRIASDVNLSIKTIDLTGGQVATVTFHGAGTWQADTVKALIEPAVDSPKPLLSINGQLADGVNNADFGFALETGTTLTKRNDSSALHGFGHNIVVRSGPPTLSYAATAAVAYITSIANRTVTDTTLCSFVTKPATLPADEHKVIFTLRNMQILNATLGDTDGLQTHTLDCELIQEDSTPPWSLTFASPATT